jgi:hypothetical protein
MSFAQGDSTQPLGLVASNVFVVGESLYGNALTVQQLSTGNVLSVSNANGTTGLFVNQSSNVGVGTAIPGYSLHVVGDVNFTGILRQSGSPYVGSQWTTGTTNVYYFSNVGIGTSAVSANLTVTGNVYASNAIQTGNIVAAGFTSNSTNTVFNFDTVAIPFLGATTLNVASTTNVYSLTSQTTINYSEDLFKRGPYLMPTTANAAAITGWISATCNAASQTASFWSATSVPVYSNAAPGPKGTGDYVGGLLLSDGRVMFSPQAASNIGMYNTASGTFSAVVPSGTTLTVTYGGAVLAPTGNVIMIPNGATAVGLFNPMNGAFSTFGSATGFYGGVLAPTSATGAMRVIMAPLGAATVGIVDPIALTYATGVAATGYTGAVLLPSGSIVLVPHTAANISVYNPVTNTITATLAHGQGTTAFIGGVLLPTGNVLLVPASSVNIVVYNPATNTITTVAHGQTVSAAFTGGVLLPTGNVIMTASRSSFHGLFNPYAGTFSTFGPAQTANGKFAGAVLVPDGRVVCVPYIGSANVGVISTMTPAPVEFCISPYFNKY